MGSKIRPQRSQKDSVIIREPAIVTGNGYRSRQSQIADQCEISFLVRLKDSALTKNDVPVTLQKGFTNYNILVLGSVIGNLSTKQSEMIDTCNLLGVKYIGKIITEKRGIYARFTRIVQ